MNWATGETRLSKKATDIFILECLPRKDSSLREQITKNFDLKFSSNHEEQAKSELKMERNILPTSSNVELIEKENELLKKEIGMFNNNPEMLRENMKFEDDAENKKLVTKIYTDQIDKLTEKLMDYKRRIRTLEKEKEGFKTVGADDDKKVNELQ